MKLLTGEEVKTNKKKSSESASARIRAMREEEDRVVSSLNQAKEKYRAERERIEKENADFIAIETSKKLQLEEEVNRLEERRKEALKPINDLQEEVDRKAKDIFEKERELHGREEEVAKREELISERLEMVVSKEEELVEKDLQLSRRESMAKASELELKESAEALSEKWIKFYEELRIANLDISQREEGVRQETEANKAVSEELAKEKERVRKEWIGIRDGYRALEQAKIHLNGTSKD